MSPATLSALKLRLELKPARGQSVDVNANRKPAAVAVVLPEYLCCH